MKTAIHQLKATVGQGTMVVTGCNKEVLTSRVLGPTGDEIPKGLMPHANETSS